MVSKTRIRDLVKAFEWKDGALDESPELLGYHDEKGRTWLRICCGANFNGSARKAAHSIRTAEVLLNRGLSVQQFTGDSGFRLSKPALRG